MGRTRFGKYEPVAPGEKLKESASELLEMAPRAFDHGNDSEAARVLDRCINAYPAFAGCHRLLGATFAHLGSSDEARAQYLEFLRLAPKDPAAPKVWKLVEDYDRARAKRVP